VCAGLLLLTATRTFGQSSQDQTAAREQRQQQPNKSGANGNYTNESSNSNARNENTDDENGTRNSRTGNQRQQQSDSDSQNQQNQNYSRDRMQSGNRSADRQGYDNRQSINDNRQWWSEGQQGYNNQGRQVGNQSRNQQYSQQSGQEYGRDEQDWNQERSGQSQINQNRWRTDREYRDAYFAGLRAGQRGANEWNYASFESSDSGNEATGQASRVRLNGKVVRTNRSSSPGGEGSRLMATVRTERGDRFIVDLGPVDEARRLELGEGDDLQVRGIRIRLGDRNLIFATDARANDESLSFRYNDAGERSDERTNYEASRNRDRQYDGYSNQSSDRSSDQYSNRSSDRQQSGAQSGRSNRSESDESSNQSQNRSRADRERD